ncbi:MAG TPA: hypothetical protein VIJ14_02020 [Rhabdochlamydiaceae bacterium]
MSVFSDSNLPQNHILQDLLQTPDQKVFKALLNTLDMNVVMACIKINPEHLNEFELVDLKNRLIGYAYDTQNGSLENAVSQVFDNILGPPPTPQQVSEAAWEFGPGADRQMNLIAKTIIGIDESSEKARIFRAIEGIPEQERESVVALALPQIRHIRDAYARANILEALTAIPSEHRKSLLDLIVFIFTPTGSDADPYNSDESADYYSHILELFLTTHNDQIVLLLTNAAPFVKTCKTLSSRATVLWNFAKIPPAEFDEVVQLGAPFSHVIYDADQKAIFLGAIGDIPAGEREEVIKHAAPILKFVEDGLGKAKILTTISRIPSGQREDAVKQAISLIKVDQGMKGKDELRALIRIIELIGKTPPGERVEVMALITTIIQAGVDAGMQYYPDEIWNLLRGITAIPQKDRTKTLDSIVYLFSRGVSAGQEARIASALGAIPKNERADKIIRAMPLIRQRSHEKNWVIILEIIPYFAPGNLDEVLKSLSDDRALESPDKFMAIQGILQQNPALAEPTWNYLFTQLQSLTDRKEVRSLALDIYNHQDVFKVHEDHPVVQEAISKLALTESSNDPKNPYQLYMKLKAMDAEPLPVVNTPVDVIDGKRYALNPETFQESAARAIPITFAQVPQNVGSEDLRKLFAALAARLAQMQPNDRDAVQNYIRETTETSFEALQANFLDDAYLNSLLRHPRGNPEDKAPVDVARFFALMNFILIQSPKVEPGQLLSP